MRKLVPRILLVSFIALALSAASSPAVGQGQTVGLFLNEAGSLDGYTLFSPLSYGTAYLIDNGGRLVNSWDTGVDSTAYLLEDGSLLRAGGGGARRFTWDGMLVWEFDASSYGYSAHHDIELLPSGNVLMIAWETKTAAEAIAAGRDPALLTDGELLPEVIIEVEPTGATGGNIVWEWHAWDHLIQDYDPTADNYGVVADHPELIDINFGQPFSPNPPDWLHANGIDYNEEFDQIVLSIRQVSELWVIDHSTTTEEASTHNGGISERGGDILYRWGNPQAYRAGDASDQKLFLQHDAQWIETGLLGEGNILVFNNGNGRPGGDYSSVDELVPPVDGFGNYAFTPGQAFAPLDLYWTYQAANPADFYSSFISGAVRLPNDNTLINSGAQGTLFEVTPEGETVWRYVSPVTRGGPLTQGQPPERNFVFRAYRYAPDFPGLAGQDLTPGQPIEILDSDKDGLTDQDEVNVYGTDPMNSDTDSDGCGDGAEVRPEAEAGAGGGRDPLYYWDFMDMWVDKQKDRRVDIIDIGAIVSRFGGVGDLNGDPLDPPQALTGYHVSADRSPPTGANVWNAGPPDALINIIDVGLAVVQFGHNCSGLP